MIKPDHNHSQAGVSLLETLAALAILALLTGAVIVMMGPDEAAERREAETLIRALAEARQEALVSGAYVGFAAIENGGGYQFYQYRDQQWAIRVDHPAFEPHQFASDDQLVLSIRQGGVAARALDAQSPEVWFDPTGLDQSFVYELLSPDGGLLIVRDGRGDLALLDPESEGAAL